MPFLTSQGRPHSPAVLKSAVSHFSFRGLLQDPPKDPALTPRLRRLSQGGQASIGHELRTGHTTAGILNFPFWAQCWVTAQVTGPRSQPWTSSVSGAHGEISSSSTKFE